MFFKKKKQRKTPNNQERQGDAFKIFTVQDYEKIAQDAVDYAKLFNKNFDYSDDSIDGIRNTGICSPSGASHETCRGLFMGFIGDFRHLFWADDFKKPSRGKRICLEAGLQRIPLLKTTKPTCLRLQKSINI